MLVRIVQRIVDLIEALRDVLVSILLRIQVVFYELVSQRIDAGCFLQFRLQVFVLDELRVLFEIVRLAFAAAARLRFEFSVLFHYFGLA